MKCECSVDRLAHLNNAQCAATYADKLWVLRANPGLLREWCERHKFAAWAEGDLSFVQDAPPPTVQAIHTSRVGLPCYLSTATTK